MSIVSGIIQRKSVKDMKTKEGKAWGNRYSFMVGTGWYSVIDSKIADTHTREMVEGLKEGDEIEFTFEDVPNPQKPGEAFHNITGACRVERINRDVPATSPKGKPYAVNYDPAGASEGDGGESTVEKKPVQVVGRGDFPYSMKISYMKDLQIGFPQATERELLERVDLLRKMADRFGE